MRKKKNNMTPTDKEIQEWFNSGTITLEMLELCIQLINKGENK